MLKIKRKIDQGIVINGNIKIYALEIKGNSVTFGIEYPTETTILREEVFNKIAEQNNAASQLNILEIIKDKNEK